ncbi:hypothetical protein PO909_000311 [Leuciscus waleckii]
MALNSADDKYDGCAENMGHQVETEYLKKELNISKSDFKGAWQAGENQFKPPEQNLTRNHSIAIYVYTDIHVHVVFNKDTRHGKQNYTSETYEWYSLYFLLTEAIQILKKTQNENVLNTAVRFGSFASSSLDPNRTDFGTVSCFDIYTCYGANVSNYSSFSDEEEVLIPPYETFNVTDVKSKRDQEDLWCETVYTLKSTGYTSYLNCSLFPRPRP